MAFQSPGPILLDLGFLQLRWYGLLIGLGFVAAFAVGQLIIMKQRPKPNFYNPDEFDNFAFMILLGGIIGARLWFVILNYDYYLRYPSEIVQIWLGGQSIQGGLIGGTIASAFYCRNTKKFLYYFSAIACVLPLAQAIGRWGNFFNEEAFGSVTDLPWKLYISHTGQFHHPTFLYEAIWNLIVFITMLFLNKYFYKDTYDSRFDLRLIAAYLMLYSTGRLIIESIRTDSEMIGIFPAASVLSIIAIGIAGILWFKSYKRQ